jgi:hypothetical protein
MNGTLKRFFVASAAIASVSTALLLSGAAQSKPYTANDAGQLERTNVSPADPDASIRGQGT